MSQMASPALTRVARGNTCTGCGLCAAIAPGAVTMTMEAPGYLRPKQLAPISFAQDAAIAAACPGITVDERPEAGAPVDDPLWGRSHFTGTGHSTDAALRHQASSGGGISALLVHALATGMVDFVVQTGADPLLPTGNVTIATHNRDEVFAAAGSRSRSSFLRHAGAAFWSGVAEATGGFVDPECEGAREPRARVEPAVAEGHRAPHDSHRPGAEKTRPLREHAARRKATGRLADEATIKHECQRHRRAVDARSGDRYAQRRVGRRRWLSPRPRHWQWIGSHARWRIVDGLVTERQ
jgi:ferredoxin